MYEHGDAFPGTPRKVFQHLRYRARITADAWGRWLWKTFLQIACVAADGIASPFRRVLEKRHGSNGLVVRAPAAESDHMLVWRARWNWRKFEQTARSSTARWILF